MKINPPKQYNVVKPFEEIQIGETVYENPDAGGVWDKVVGKIIWKGSVEDLKLKKYTSWYMEFLVDWCGGSIQLYLEYVVRGLQLVIVKHIDNYYMGPNSTMYGYNWDTSSVVCFKYPVK